MYLNQGKADGDGKGEWILETTGSGVLLTGHREVKDRADLATTPDIGGEGQ